MYAARPVMFWDHPRRPVDIRDSVPQPTVQVVLVMRGQEFESLRWLDRSAQRVALVGSETPVPAVVAPVSPVVSSCRSERRSPTVSPRTSPTNGVRYETWPLPDPAEWDIDGIRPLRDYIDTKLRVQAPSCTALGYGRLSATATQLGVLVWWSPFIRIIANVALTSDIPVKEHGPDGPYGTQLRGALDDRLDLSSGDPEPEQPEDGLHDDDGCRDSSN